MPFFSDVKHAKYSTKRRDDGATIVAEPNADPSTSRAGRVSLLAASSENKLKVYWQLCSTMVIPKNCRLMYITLAAYCGRRGTGGVTEFDVEKNDSNCADC